MCQASTEFSHLVDFVHTAAFEEVQAIEVFFIMGEEHGVRSLFNGNHCFEDGAFAVLDPLTHRVEVGSQVNRCREDTLAVLTFALAVKLLPPFVHHVKLRLVVGEDFDLLAFAIECVAHSSIVGRRIFFHRHISTSSLFHIGSTGNKLFDVIARTSDREQTHRSEYREAAAHVVGDDEALVTFLIGSDACSALLFVGYRYDHLACHFDAALFFALLLEQTESQSSFGGRTRFGYVDDTELAALEVFAEFVEIVFADIVTCKKHYRVLAVVGEPFETVAEGFDHCT
ncbi:hypothetical protein EVA_05664 [gut metagenome]|uniref:Uncharacterized protein n=1 Tax=gut metagenome TaxID=749906 RepID=J9GTY2_9ZZZZ